MEVREVRQELARGEQKHLCLSAGKQGEVGEREGSCLTLMPHPRAAKHRCAIPGTTSKWRWFTSSEADRPSCREITDKMLYSGRLHDVGIELI